MTFTILPGTAAAAPATSPQQAAKLVSDADHQLEVVTEQVNAARVVLDQQKAAVASAEKHAAAAQVQLKAMAGQIRQLARSAYTGGGNDAAQLDVLMTSKSADAFVSQLGTLDAIAGHTNDVVAQVSKASHTAAAARAKADAAATAAQATFDQVAAKQRDLQAKIADYKRQYAALTAPQRAVVNLTAAGSSVAVPSAAPAATGAAQAAVSTALAQVGKPYVWGAAGPNSFDCSGLMQYAYSAAGISLPHSSSAQSSMGVPVSRSALQPGDLVFFYSPVSHVGMYIGNGQMVHAATSGEPVKVVSLDSMPNYNSARRIATG
ncbi:MAG TPA: C40 family peptidase [Blastococcus sp.]|jgi:cell wall-associated NlpC family hydrolase|nr:C40 family peptidase [Blastococcus sp.]